MQTWLSKGWIDADPVVVGIAVVAITLATLVYLARRLRRLSYPRDRDK